MKYMVEMWKDGKGIESPDFVWYHDKPKQAKEWARSYAKKIGAQVFVVLRVFNVGHYKTVYTEEISS